MALTFSRLESQGVSHSSRFRFDQSGCFFEYYMGSVIQVFDGIDYSLYWHSRVSLLEKQNGQEQLKTVL